MTRLEVLWGCARFRDVGSESTHKLVTVLAATAASSFNYDIRSCILQLTVLMGGGSLSRLCGSENIYVVKSFPALAPRLKSMT